MLVPKHALYQYWYRTAHNWYWYQFWYRWYRPVPYLKFCSALPSYPFTMLKV
jgi:hypothetical protein